MRIFPAIAFSLLLGGDVFAQQTPHLAYVYPAGGKIGTTFQITVGGQFLLAVSNAFVTGSGVNAAVLDHNRPMNQKEFNDLRDRLNVLQQKFQAARKGDAGTNVWTAADAAESEQIRAKILRNPPNRTANPAMVDTVTIKISIATNAEPGEHEIRLATPNALSNPLRFCAGTLPEISKPAAKPANPDLERFLERIGGRPAPAGTPKYEGRISLPAIVNGQIMPGGVDRYRFFATHGRSLVVAVSARQLMPYLADAVPGWFEAVLTIYDSKGKELASEERFRFKPDPVIHFVAPRDGEYTVELHDSIYRGREDFVYRLAIGELPFVTGIFPPGGRLGEKTSVALTGWNLPEQSLSRDNPEAGITSLNGNFFNAVPFAVDDLPECFEREPDNSVETAQSITLPIIINGRIGRPGERDVFKFDGRAGQQIVAEVFARRLDSPLDSFLRLTDADGKQLAFNDDFEDKGSGLNTHHADSYLAATLPANGSYFIQISDTQGQGGPEFAYRLRVSEPRPDFALRVVPSSLSLRTGMSGPLTVFALRRDGFTNAIYLELKNAPEGFSLSGGRVLENQDKAQFTLKAPPQPSESTMAISIEGYALIAGKLVARTAVPAEDMMQAFAYRHLVPSKELAVSVNGPPRLFMRDAFKIISATPVKIPSGGTVGVRVSAPAGALTERFKLELDNAPEGISLDSVSPIANGVELVVRCDAKKAKVGAEGNLICNMVPNNQAPAQNPKNPGNQPRRGVAATLPAIPFKIVAE
jgi:hypothetical protein